MTDKFEKVTVNKKANVYFAGKVNSRTVLFADGSRKTLGFMMAGEYEFNTEVSEVMEVLAGEVSVLLPENKNWQSFDAGDKFKVPEKAVFKLKVHEFLDYCCSYGK